MSARVEAATEAIADVNGAENVARLTLAAADAVMFSDAAIERAAKVLWDREMQAPWSSVADGFKKPFINEARAVIAALKGDA